MLNQYQRGSLFGAIIVTVAFSAAFSTIKYPHRNPSDYPAVNINSDSQRGESFWEKASRDPVAVFTGALVIVGSAQAALFLWQLDLMRKGLRDAKNSADAAKDTAEATGEAVAISRESAVRELRAYVL